MVNDSNEQYEWIVDDDEKRLDAFLCHALPGGIGKKKVQAELERGRCLVNGVVERFASRRLRLGDRIAINWITEKKIEDSASAGIKNESFSQIEILFDDEAITAICKPEGILYDAFLAQRKGLFPVHRLDKETSGVLLFAKNEKFAHILSEEFKGRKIQKRYWAMAQGVGEERERERSGRCDNLIGLVKQYQGHEIQGVVEEGGRSAVTNWTVHKRKKIGRNEYALIECRPLTGRKHQIRVHLQNMGWPILGDPLYAPDEVVLAAPRMMLHAERIQFDHPLTGVKVEIIAKVPKNFREFFS